MKKWIALAVVGVVAGALLMPGCYGSKKKAETAPKTSLSPTRAKAAQECYAAAIPFELAPVIEPVSAPAAETQDQLAMNTWQPIPAEASMYYVQPAEVLVSSDLLREPVKASVTAKPAAVPAAAAPAATVTSPRLSMIRTSYVEGPELEQASFLLRNAPTPRVVEAEVMSSMLLGQARSEAAKDEPDLRFLRIPEIGMLDNRQPRQF